MTSRPRDGDDSTRRRILQAAGELFADEGFAGTTIRDICAKAKVNLALVNYYFRSKAGLYQATWRNALELADTLYPIDGRVSCDAPPEERLCGTVRALLSRMTDQDHLRHFHRIRMMEFANPTGLLDDMMSGMVKRNRKHILEILRDLLPDTDEDRLELCHMSIISQCLMARPKRLDRPIRHLRRFSSKDVDFLTEHIFSFSRAGILAIRRQTLGPGKKSSRGGHG